MGIKLANQKLTHAKVNDLMCILSFSFKFSFHNEFLSFHYTAFARSFIRHFFTFLSVFI